MRLVFVKAYLRSFLQLVLGGPNCWISFAYLYSSFKNIEVRPRPRIEEIGETKYTRKLIWCVDAVLRTRAVLEVIEKNQVPKDHILDFGSGAGYFLAAYRLESNSAICTGMDLQNAFYEKFFELNELNRIQVLPEDAKTPSNFLDKLDWRISVFTAFMICFDEGWGDDDWTKFLRELEDSLLTNALIFLQFNSSETAQALVDKFSFRPSETIANAVYKICSS